MEFYPQPRHPQTLRKRNQTKIPPAKNITAFLPEPPMTRRFKELDKLFYHLTLMSVTVVLVGSLFAWSLVYFLDTRDFSFAARILPLLPTGLLFLSTVFMQISFCQAAYLRAHKKEPFLVLSIVQGLLTCTCLWLFGKYFGVLGMISGYLLVVSLFTLPYGTWVWKRCKDDWHRDN